MLKFTVLTIPLLVLQILMPRSPLQLKKSFSFKFHFWIFGRLCQNPFFSKCNFYCQLFVTHLLIDKNKIKLRFDNDARQDRFKTDQPKEKCFIFFHLIFCAFFRICAVFLNAVNYANLCIFTEKNDNIVD